MGESGHNGETGNLLPSRYDAIVIRRLFNIACLGSAILFVGLCVLFVRSTTTMDVVLTPTGRDSVLQMTSHRGRWLEFTVYSGWPGARGGWWSGRDQRDTGPFKFWQAHRSYARLGIWFREGQLIMPRTAPGQGVAYEGAYAQAQSLGYPGMLSNGAAGWMMVRAWEIKFAIVWALGAAAVLPLLWVGHLAMRRSRRGRRWRAGLCPECAYDLRASRDCCPECGAAIIGEH